MLTVIRRRIHTRATSHQRVFVFVGMKLLNVALTSTAASLSLCTALWALMPRGYPKMCKYPSGSMQGYPLVPLLVPNAARHDPISC